MNRHRPRSLKGVAGAERDDVGPQDRVASALEEYSAALESGRPISRDVLLEKYADVREELVGCLDNLQFIREMALDLDSEPHATETTKTAIHANASVGDFQIIREIGRGGMGVVYEAEQLSLGRTVALKVLPYAAMLDRKAITRFKNEARAAATLDHPNIVPVFAVGNDRGIYYYAMSMVNGLTNAESVNQ